MGAETIGGASSRGSANHILSSVNRRTVWHEEEGRRERGPGGSQVLEGRHCAPRLWQGTIQLVVVQKPRGGGGGGGGGGAAGDDLHMQYTRCAALEHQARSDSQRVGR